jgi:hypothetical protein
MAEDHIRLWNEWLKTEDGCQFIGSCPSDDMQERAARGRAWVKDRLPGEEVTRG